MISTPGITGNCGKWPWKNGSLMVTFLTPTQLSSRSMSIHAIDQQERIAVRQQLHHPLMSAVPSCLVGCSVVHPSLLIQSSSHAAVPGSTARAASSLIRCGTPHRRPPSSRQSRPVLRLARPTAGIGRAGVPPIRAPGGTSSLTWLAPGDLRAGADLDVPDHARLAAHDDEIAELRRTGDADLADDHAMPADDDVVPDLDQIINFRAFADDRILKSAPVDGSYWRRFRRRPG